MFYFPTSGIRARFYCLGIVIGVGLKMEESSGAGMIRLTSSNYSIWKPRMEDILYCKDLYAPIDGDNSKPKDMSEAEWKIMHRKTVALIRQWVDQSVFHHVSQETMLLSFGKN